MDTRFMKHSPIMLLAFFASCLTSCDYSMVVAVRNYREPCKVNVTYVKTGNSVWDKDSLSLKKIDDSNHSGSVLRTNTSDSSYFFVAPQNREIDLSPSALNNQPIKQIGIKNSPDSTWLINLWNKNEFKNLKKTGQIKTKSFLMFTTAIIIENK